MASRAIRPRAWHSSAAPRRWAGRRPCANVIWALTIGPRTARSIRSEASALQRGVRLTEGHEPAAYLVPQHEAHAPEALQQRQPADIAQLRVVAKCARQPVIRNAAAQVVHMMHAD